MTHDLKTPLSATYMAQTIIERDLPEEAKSALIKDMLAIMRRNLERLDLLLKVASRDHFNLAASATGELKLNKRDNDLWGIVEPLIRDLRPLAEKANTQIVNEVPQDLVVFADAVLLTQVFQNLLSNAIEYTENGKITIGGEAIEGLSNVGLKIREKGSRQSAWARSLRSSKPILGGKGWGWVWRL